MAFFKKIQQKINGKWYPKSVTVGKPVTTKEVSDRLAQIIDCEPCRHLCCSHGTGRRAG